MILYREEKIRRKKRNKLVDIAGKIAKIFLSINEF